MEDEIPPRDTAIRRLMSEKTPGDSRQARQLARRRLITESVMAAHSIRIEDLAQRFDISLMTVHRDLDELEARGILRKTRGLVSGAPTSLMEASDVYRASRNLPQKAAIAEAAMRFVEPGRAIFLDDATTVLQMAPHLEKVTPLTVISNSLTVMTELRGVDGIDLIALGGQFHRWCNSFMGHVTTGDILRMRADCVFLSMAAIIDCAVFHQSDEVVAVKRAMMQASSQKILLVDHTKFERRALHRLCHICEFDAVIVDDGLSEAHLDALRAQGAAIIVASVRKAGDAIGP